MRSERAAAASGAVYVLAVMTGNAMYEAGKGGGQDGPALLADLQRGTSSLHTVGLALEVLGFAAFLVFLGALHRILRGDDRSDHWLAGTALGAGLVTVAVKIGSLGPDMAARRRRDELTPDLARTLHDLANADFVISGYTSGIFVTATATALLLARILPRWLAISGIVVGVLTVTAGTAGVLDPAGYVPVPFLLGLLWVFVTSTILAIRVTTAQEDGPRRRAGEPVQPGAARTA